MGIVPYLCLLLSCLAGVQSDVVLTQPKSAEVKPGQSHRLSCAVRGFSFSKNSVNWVKQVSGKGLEWVARMRSNGEKYYAPSVKDRFEVSKDSSTVYLQMNNLKLNDTATYYCARDWGGYGTRSSPLGTPELLCTWEAEDSVGEMVLAVAGNSKGNHQCSATYTGVSPRVPQTTVPWDLLSDRCLQSCYHTLPHDNGSYWNSQELSVFIQNPGIEEMWIDKTATVKCTVLCTDPEDIHISWHVGGKEKTKGFTPIKRREMGPDTECSANSRSVWRSGSVG
ncbi:uncharacterized protein [Hemitrygon akajei]|uniref:uncharacterized protein n=1 Tax=Hemitrygon akajei TaxID=2704970 RepID=UPI003BF9F7BC